MKFSWKVFISSIIVTALAFGLGGTLMISSLFQGMLDQEIQMAIQENRYLCFSFQTAVNSLSGDETLRPAAIVAQLEKASISKNTQMNITCASGVSFLDGQDFAQGIEVNQRASRVVRDENGIAYVQVVSYFFIDNTDYYLENITDISAVYQMREQYVLLYRWILLAVVGIASLLMGVLTHFLTRPLKRLTATAQEIAAGSFSTRAQDGGSDEIGTLTRAFNSMAEVVEEKIYVLEETARQREDFVASFAHELKTPLTSIIGYADMLRSYDMDAADRHTAANYIFSEGKRLEALSLHLLDLIVLHKQDFPLEKVNSSSFFREAVQILQPLLQKYQQRLEVTVQPALLLLEPSLLKTLVYNLIDNACKASPENGRILLTGRREEDVGYTLSVQDFGRGIPKEEIPHIIEPFYMVDKSRARSQNGAGIGLALCQEIAAIHGGSLHIESTLGEGTCVSLPLKEAEPDENHESSENPEN